MNVLVSLHPGYGLGDAVQMSAVLRHLRKYRSAWCIHYRAEEGRHQVGRGIAAATFAQTPTDAPHYDAEAQICLYGAWRPWSDRPSTHVSAVLHDLFGMGWDAECGRYEVAVSARATQEARMYIRHCFGRITQPAIVGIHTQGHTAKADKNLTSLQEERIIDAVRRCGRMPFSFKNHSGNAEANCAIIRQCDAFVGIDSGPAKCAAATDVPALVVWTGHHPAQYFDPAPNVTHLIPQDHRGLGPVAGDAAVLEWFDDNYSARQYDRDPVVEVCKWLAEVLK